MTFGYQIWQTGGLRVSEVICLTKKLNIPLTMRLHEVTWQSNFIINLLLFLAQWCSGYHYRTLQLQLTKLQLRFCAGSKAAYGVSVAFQRFVMVRISDNGRARNKTKCLSSVSHTTKTINHHHIIITTKLYRVMACEIKISTTV